MSNISKQDRQGSRTPADLERRYNFGKSFAEVMEIATDARDAAENAASGVDGLDEKLDQTEIFNRLTNNGQSQGIFRGEDGEIYINASFLVTGIIKSPDGTSLVIDLDNGTADLTGSIKTTTELVDGNELYARMRPTEVSVVSDDDETFSALCKDGVYANNPASYYRAYALPSGEAGFIFRSGDVELVGSVSNDRVYITGLTEPVYGYDVVNKAYVDALEARVAALEAALATS